jgi:phosphoenolpyruvate-protein kinase (PTS system EI component)
VPCAALLRYTRALLPPLVQGILTTRGGMTSHAAVVARGWGKTCVTGCSEVTVEPHGRQVRVPAVKCCAVVPVTVSAAVK